MSSVKSGWMVKRGALIPSWKRRWFVLSADGVLRYYENNDLKTEKGSVNLSGAAVSMLSRAESAQKYSRSFAIEVLASSRALPLDAETEAEQKSWAEALSAIAKGKGLSTVPATAAAPVSTAAPATAAAPVAAAQPVAVAPVATATAAAPAPVAFAAAPAAGGGGGLFIEGLVLRADAVPTPATEAAFKTFEVWAASRGWSDEKIELIRPYGEEMRALVKQAYEFTLVLVERRKTLDPNTIDRNELLREFDVLYRTMAPKGPTTKSDRYESLIAKIKEQPSAKIYPSVLEYRTRFTSSSRAKCLVPPRPCDVSPAEWAALDVIPLAALEAKRAEAEDAADAKAQAKADKAAAKQAKEEEREAKAAERAAKREEMKLEAAARREEAAAKREEMKAAAMAQAAERMAALQLQQQNALAAAQGQPPAAM